MGLARDHLLLSGSSMQVVGYTFQAAALPFPVFVLATFINGAGLAIQDAQANGYVASLADSSETKMGFVQAAYGAGALVAPLVSTLNPIRSAATLAVHLLPLFLFVYVGVEVTISGWIVSFMIAVRGGDPSAGYIPVGFNGGLTLGHILLLPVKKKIGKQRVVYIYGLAAIALELVIWLVPSLIGGVVSVSFVGLVLGPMYPIMMNHAGRVFPRWLLTGSIGWIAGIATRGAAIVQFVTRAIASKTGIKSLEPV
ncbi:MFS domain-containing protein [Mycena venus]|uniref:MFS domain-containing protein n=1 Tax=Mycena venus TaxID=2733690 RepID=A0A8H6XIY8_9AGAR|nr:MFS domain-containing protein [Mycena venus]